ncbi:MAG: hypothetical protein ACYC64_18965 [Armatimonadota bacterium]
MLVRMGPVEWRLVPTAGEVEGTAVRGWKAALVAYAGVLTQWAALPVIPMVHTPFAPWYLGLCFLGLLQWLPVRGWDGGWWWA